MSRYMLLGGIAYSIYRSSYIMRDVWLVCTGLKQDGPWLNSVLLQQLQRRHWGNVKVLGSRRNRNYSSVPQDVLGTRGLGDHPPGWIELGKEREQGSNLMGKRLNGLIHRMLGKLVLMQAFDVSGPIQLLCPPRWSSPSPLEFTSVPCTLCRANSPRSF